MANSKSNKIKAKAIINIINNHYIEDFKSGQIICCINLSYQPILADVFSIELKPFNPDPSWSDDRSKGERWKADEKALNILRKNINRFIYDHQSICRLYGLTSSDPEFSKYNGHTIYLGIKN